ncbi:MAG: hypothetical protein ACKO45_00460 [Cyanobium sp.]
MPSVISTVDHNVLLDPRQEASHAIAEWNRIPLNWPWGLPLRAQPRNFAL